MIMVRPLYPQLLPNLLPSVGTVNEGREQRLHAAIAVHVPRSRTADSNDKRQNDVLSSRPPSGAVRPHFSPLRKG
jgi:hypothetical protein